MQCSGSVNDFEQKIMNKYNYEQVQNHRSSSFFTQGKTVYVLYVYVLILFRKRH